MTFESAVRGIPEVSELFRPGLQAIKREHGSKVTKAPAVRWMGSVNLDSGLATRYPGAPLWDYAIGFRRRSGGEQVAYVEVHPAHTGEVKAVLAKKAWLTSWLRGPAAALGNLRTFGFFWVATRGVHIQKASRQARLLALSGIKVVPLVRIV